MDELLARIAELQARIDTLADMSRDDAAQLAADLRVALAELADAAETAEQLDQVAAGLEQVTAVETHVQELDAAAEALETRRAELRAQVAPAEEPAPEVEAEVEAPEPEEVETPEPVAVAAAAAPARPRVQVRPPARTRPQAAPAQAPSRTAIVAAAQDSGVADGTELTRDQVVDLVMRTHDRFPGFSSETRHIPVVTLRSECPPERMLSTVDVAENMRRIREHAGIERVLEASRQGQAITAAGAFCEPFQPIYSLADISTDVRPVRDSLAQFGAASRGGIVTRAPLSIDQFSGAVDEWTQEDSVAALTDANTRKPCLRVVCPTPSTSKAYAVPLCLTFDNLAAIADPENVADAISKSQAWHARFAERLLLTKMIAASGQPTVPETTTLGAIPELLAAWDRAAVAIRNRQRATEDFPLEVWAPVWLLGVLRTDALRTMPGDQLYQVNRAWIEARAADRNISVHWTMEMPTTGVSANQDFNFQGSGGTLNGWPDKATWIMSHPGAHIFFGLPTIDFGIVRDSTLNPKNDYQMFSETIEGHSYVGLESIAATHDICGSGARAGLEDTSALCDSGS